MTSDELIDKVGHYRIFFTFSVRNGNCMVYPLDVSTGSELTNSSMTENGFMLDLAKSRYLQINVKREILTESADGLVEDTRANGPAKDGAKYVDEGIYTITATNQYTNQTTTKKIYVGTNNVLKAFMTSGLSIEEINKLMQDGYAPLDPTGTKYQLHHIGQNNDSPLAVLTQAEHTGNGNDPIWHTLTEGFENPSSQPGWAKIRENFWKDYAKKVVEGSI